MNTIVQAVDSSAGDVLVVDDAVDNLRFLTDVLNGAGYNTRPAGNGELALRSARAKRPALILLDIKMPGMDGFEVCRRLKVDLATHDIPVIFLSGLADAADKSKGFALGAVDYIIKPFHAEEVLARVRVHLALVTANELLMAKNVVLQHANEELARSNEQLGLEVAERRAAETALRLYRAEAWARREAEIKRMAEMSRRLVEIQEAERRALALELHDVASPNLAALQINLRMLQADLPAHVMQDFESRFAELRRIIAAIAKNLRDLGAILRPTTLEYSGLLPALEDYARSASFGVPITIAATGGSIAERLPSEIEFLLFRIAQEAVTNAAKHAQANSIEIRLDRDGDSTRMTVQDDGKGYDRACVGQDERPGLGLVTMQERAELAGGRFSVDSSPGNGTRISVEI